MTATIIPFPTAKTPIVVSNDEATGPPPPLDVG